MGEVQRNAIIAPNNTHPGDRRANGSVPLAGGAPTVHKDRSGPSADRRANGFMPLGGESPQIHVPSAKFDVRDAQMPQPASKMQPGMGQIPVNPFQAGTGAPSDIVGILRDSAKTSVPK